MLDFPCMCVCRARRTVRGSKPLSAAAAAGLGLTLMGPGVRRSWLDTSIDAFEAAITDHGKLPGWSDTSDAHCGVADRWNKRVPEERCMVMQCMHQCRSRHDMLLGCSACLLALQGACSHRPG